MKWLRSPPITCTDVQMFFFLGKHVYDKLTLNTFILWHMLNTKTSVELSKVFFPPWCSIYFITFAFFCHDQHSFNLSPHACPPFTGDTLLAIRAPIGTQLEVPIPEAVSHVCISNVPQVRLRVVFSHVSNRVFCVCVSRSSTDKESTRYVWRVRLVPSRFCWSIRTRPVPLLLFCPSLLQMTSFRTSQHRRLPPSCPLLPPRSTQISAFSMQSVLFKYWTAYYIIPAVVPCQSFIHARLSMRFSSVFSQFA